MLSWCSIRQKVDQRTKQTRAAGGQVFLIYTTFAEVRSKSRIWPSNIRSSPRTGIVPPERATRISHCKSQSRREYVLFVGQFHKFVTLDLSIGAQVFMINKPAANLTVGPSTPKGVARRNVITPVGEVSKTRVFLSRLITGSFSASYLARL